MLVLEHGPFGLLLQARSLTGIEHDDEGEQIAWSDNNPLSCILCTSVWVALLMLVLPTKIKEILAISGVVTIIREALT